MTADRAAVGPVRAPRLHVMTFNIRRRMPHLLRRSPDAWSRRRSLVRRLVAAERPTVLCLQEALPDQTAWVRASLGDGYRSVGSGRGADGGGEGTPIVYDERRLRLLTWTQQALSDTPEVPGSRSWGNVFPRIVVSAGFADRETGRRFTVLNTHLDPLSPRSRLMAARVLRRAVESRGEPVVLTADANAHVGSPPYRELTRGGLLRDAWTTADRRLTENWGTYSNYRSPRRGGRRIDWLLVSGGITVEAAAVNAARFGGAAASDHEPVQAVIRLGAGSE